ncbi:MULTISPECIES: hypothetical protein [unclassified Streptomyces]|uniref:hypothetical protein n=1 Tax=unclassified Streptomyces TaxID=2593676 RepID=UPI0019270AE7|nr:MULTISPECIES: hypothetical protein [unclassified Streptomyces]
MPDIMELDDLDALIGDLDARISESTLPTAEADTAHCSGVCTILVCTVIVC